MTTLSPLFPEIKNLADLEKAKKANINNCTMLLFWASWHEPCSQLRDIMNESLSDTVHYENLKFYWCDVDTARDLVDSIDIT